MTGADPSHGTNFPDFNSVRRLLAALPGPDRQAAGAARTRTAQLTKPPGSLGRLEDIAEWTAAWQGRHPARADCIQTLLFAGNHGVAARGVSAYPAAATAQMVANFAAGGAAINQLCDIAGAELTVTPLALASPTADFTEQPAMSEEDCAAAFSMGFNQVDPAADLLCLGEMGIGNSTAAAALCLALFGGAPEDWTGRGTGVDDAGLARKQAVAADGLARHGAALAHPLEALRRLGGRELAALAGAVLSARCKKVPVLLDGFICCAAAAVLARAAPGALDHCLAGHCSAEAAHGRLLQRLGLTPLLDLGLRLGEGSGAVLAALLVKAALAAHAGMATFAEAGVSDRE